MVSLHFMHMSLFFKDLSFVVSPQMSVASTHSGGLKTASDKDALKTANTHSQVILTWA